MKKTYLIAVNQTVEIKIDESKFTPELMEKYLSHDSINLESFIRETARDFAQTDNTLFEIKKLDLKASIFDIETKIMSRFLS